MKWDSKGDVKRYKTRLIVNGFTQKESIDFIETLSLASTKNFFRVIITLMIYYDLKLYQIDIKIIFLNDDIDETIYMIQPPHFELNDLKKIVCKLNKFIYGSNKCHTVAA